jgi:hypothetical protein
MMAEDFFFSLPFETGSCYVAHASLERWILLYLAPEYWDYRLASPHWAEG